jgi:outer membrane protein assembly factor BamB
LAPPHIRPAARLRVGRFPCLPNPAVSPDSVFAADGHHVVRVDATGLTLVWSITARHMVPLIVCGDTLILAGHASPDQSAVAIEDGAPLWGPARLGRCLLWGPALLSVTPVSVVDARNGRSIDILYEGDELIGDSSLCGDVLVGTDVTGARVSALDLKGRRMLWSRDLFGEVGRAIGSAGPMRMVSGGLETIVVSNEDGVAGVDVSDGSLQWIRKANVPHYLPTVEGGRLYILSVARREPAHLLCLGVATGEELYDVAEPFIAGEDRPFRGVTDGALIAFATNRGILLGCDTRDGTAAWCYKDSRTLMPPVFESRRLFVPSVTGELLVFDLGRPAAGVEGDSRA